MTTLLNDIKYALRQLKKQPVFATVVVLILALGIGANTAIFNLVHAVLLRPLSVEQPQELVLLTPEGFFPGGSMRSSISHSYLKMEYLKEHNEVFSKVLGRCLFDANIGLQGQTTRIQAEMVCGDYFDTLGVHPASGRLIQAADNQRPSEHPVAVLSADYWRSSFQKDPSVVGSTIHVNGYPLTVIGVSEAGFTGIEPGTNPQVRIPLMMAKQMIPHIKWIDLDDPMDSWVQVMGRRKAGVSLAQTQTALGPLHHRFVTQTIEQAMTQHPEKQKERYRHSTINAQPGQWGTSQLRQVMGKPLWMLMAMVGLVLLLACVNIANLLIGRSVLRQGELAVRNALGAGRIRLVSQLLVESVILAVLGGGAGILMTTWTTRLLLRFIPSSDTPPVLATGINGTVLAFSLAVVCATVLIFGLLPAFSATRFQLAAVLKQQNTRTLTRSRCRRLLVVVQVCLSLLLLMAGSLFVRSLRNLSNQETGFQTEGIVAFSMDPTLNGFDTQQSKQIYAQLKEKLDGLSYVESSALAMVRILDDSSWTCTVATADHPGQAAHNIPVFANGISTDYFTTLGIPIKQGRDFDTRDSIQAPKVAIVNEAFNQRFLKQFPGHQSALGSHLGWGIPGQPLNMEIVGIVGNTKNENLREAISPQIYTPYVQAWTALGMTGYVRSDQPAQAVFKDIQWIVKELDTNLPIHAMRTLNEQRTRSLCTERLIALLATTFGGFAALLTAIGLYGVLNFSVIRRTQELGLRMALGAQPHNIIKIVLREVLILVGFGTALALPVAFGLGRLITSQLYGVAPHDLAVTVLALTLLAVVAICAAALPAWRAARIDPMEALRYE
ncbi:ABC transporter permease [Planctomycetota bacterium]